MKPVFWARRAHKWLALVIGVQALFWMISGLYMTVISIEIIHGNHLAHDAHRTALPGDMEALLAPEALRSQHPGLAGFRLKSLQGRAVYELDVDGERRLVDARDGQRLDPLDERAAIALARSFYAGEADIASVALLHTLPQEVQSRRAPLWRVDFADRSATSLYVEPDTGELTARRHRLWRWFDFMWMFHIMDYQNRTDVNNTLIRIASGAGLVFALSGVWLLVHRIGSGRGGPAT